VTEVKVKLELNHKENLFSHVTVESWVPTAVSNIGWIWDLE
jgi:hypothetical protein